MTVKELINILTVIPENFEVGIEAGYDNENNLLVANKLSGEYGINCNTREVILYKEELNGK
ncbi:hypothetical protein [Fusobacterium ulcerans]|uniref:hypothetical protein n=1 Tax=Fusobacterium ulcerans TaxID=861 RepID=UPI0030AE33B7